MEILADAGHSAVAMETSDVEAGTGAKAAPRLGRTYPKLKSLIEYMGQ